MSGTVNEIKTYSLNEKNQIVDNKEVYTGYYLRDFVYPDGTSSYFIYKTQKKFYVFPADTRVGSLTKDVLDFYTEELTVSSEAQKIHGLRLDKETKRFYS